MHTYKLNRNSRYCAPSPTATAGSPSEPSPGADAEVMATADGFDMKFFSYVKGAAPGQSAVVYDGDTVIASGFIR